MATDSLPPLRDIIKEHGLSARKSLGQHFLLDGNLLTRIVGAAGGLEGMHVIEIGPGPGGLTRALLQSPAASVTAVEKDARCIAALQSLQQAAGERLRLVEADALAFSPLCVPAPRAIVANLPYNIGTELLVQWLDDIADHLTTESEKTIPHITSLTLMFQKEVAERIVAAPGSKAYGRLAVLAGWLCESKKCFDVPAAAFTPPPKVDSSVIRLVPRPAPLVAANKETLQRVVAAAFGQRRKMLRASLKSLGVEAERLLARAGIDPTRRPETLTIKEFAALANALDSDQSSHR